MQKFERSLEPPPPYLSSSRAAETRRNLTDLFQSSREKIAQTRVTRNLLPLEDSGLMERLHRLFRGKCAFCEAPVPSQPYRFRPPYEASPLARTDTAHLYYTWLADAWENIYPICSGCRPTEPQHFPVRGGRAPLPEPDIIKRYADENVGLWRNYPPVERPLLIEPCIQVDFVSHFHPTFGGELYPLTDRASFTIGHFNLNRPERKAERAAAYREYIGELRELIEPIQPPGAAARVFDFQTLPFGGTWYLYLRRLALELARQDDARPKLSQAKIATYLMRLHRRSGAMRDLDAALGWLQTNDENGPPSKPVVPQPRRSKARVTDVSIRNFRGVEALDFHVGSEGNGLSSDRTPCLLILGENATGKSTILEALALTLSGRLAREELGLDPSGLRLDPRYMGSGDSRPVHRAMISLRFNDGEERQLSIDANGFREDGRQDLPPVFAYGAFRLYLAGRRRYSPAKSIRNLFQTDKPLSNPEGWLLSLGEPEFDAVIRTLRPILSVEGEFQVIRRDKERSRCLMVTAIPGPDGRDVLTETPLSLVSSGFRSVLAMVCDILEGLMDSRLNPDFETFSTARAVILVDEIEAHLHPRWKMRIMRGLRDALEAATIVATTHDPLCLRGMNDGEVLVLHRIAGTETTKTNLPVFVERLEQLPDVSQLTVEQLLTSDFFSMYSTDTPETEERLAMVADLLARRLGGEVLSEAEFATLRLFEREVASALPVGATQVQRIVEDAVAEYLKERRTASAERLTRLQADTKRRIVDALRAL